jgi:tRNA A-37 threonylcarbamoyl transferase component Bud32
MTAGGNGDDGRAPPRPAADTPGKAAVRAIEPGAKDSLNMGAADTAVAMAVSSTGETIAAGTGAGAEGEPEKPATEEDLLVGTTLLGRYQITKKIGQGGMGAVYEGTHTLIGKRVAVKVLLDKYAKKDQIVARLEQEARLASAIGHEHIIDITDFGTTSDGRTFVVMEFLEGESLAECLQREGTLPESRILHIAHQIASALGAAHAKGILHRDVKPENVFLLRRKDRDFVKVVDFGISKNLRSTGEGPDSPRLTQTGMVLGTPLYMSPEQARGDEELDARIDVYALGVIMYELATGRVPFAGNNYLTVISKVLNDDPVPPREIRPELTAEFEAVILKALEKDRDRRYQSTDEIIADLDTLLQDPMRSTQRPRIVAPRRRGRGGSLRILAWIAGVSVVIAAVVVTVVMTMGGGDTKAAAGLDASVRGAIVVDAAVAPGAPDARAEAADVEIYIDTVPSKALVHDYAGGRTYKTPLVLKMKADDAPIELETSLDGYEPLTFTVDPAKDRGTKAAPIKKKLVKAARPSSGGGGGSKKKVDAGVPQGPKTETNCPDGLPPNPVTGKCAR